MTGRVPGDVRKRTADPEVTGVALMAAEREALARLLFATEQCDRRQREDLEANWLGRLDDNDRDDYREQADAILASTWLADRDRATAARVVAAVEAVLDDADQGTDSPEQPNRIAVWGVRRVLMQFGGEPHRWPVPAEFCVECGHSTTAHQEECNHRYCDCLLSGREAGFGRDEEMDDAITQALWEDAVAEGEPWATGSCPMTYNEDHDAAAVAARLAEREAALREELGEAMRLRDLAVERSTESARVVRRLDARVAEVADVAEERGYEVQRLRDLLAERGGEEWPCANYTRPVTCLTAPSTVTGRCDWCAGQAEHGGEVGALAEAWEQGYDARGRDIANEGLTYTTLTPNPYRDTTPAQQPPDPLAEAWDDGYHAGHEDARAVQATYPEPTPNPHAREQQADGGES